MQIYTIFGQSPTSSWKDFPLYGEGDTTEDNLMKSGYVGAFIHELGIPLAQSGQHYFDDEEPGRSQDANYIAILPFKNDAGQAMKYGYALTDRNLFFPASNKNPVASLLYLDWVTRQDTLTFLQFGEEGVTHKLMSNSAVQTLAATGDKIMNSPNNIDYTLTINGIKMPTMDLTIKSLALAYPSIDSSYVKTAYYASAEPRRTMGRISSEIAAEAGIGQVLKEKRDALFAQSITAPVARFDAVWDAGYRDYLNSGGQAIIDERAMKWTQFYGNKTSIE